MTTKRDLELLYEIGCLRFLQRNWRQFLNADFQNEAEHTLRVIWIALIIAQYEKVVNKEKIIKMALIHDISESRTGDLHYVSRQYSARDEKKAIEDILKDTALEKELVPLWEEYEKRDSIEAKILLTFNNTPPTQLDQYFERQENVTIAGFGIGCDGTNSANLSIYYNATLLYSTLITTAGDESFFHNWFLDNSRQEGIYTLVLAVNVKNLCNKRNEGTIIDTNHFYVNASPPYVVSNAPNPPSPAGYYPNRVYNFTATITDNKAIDKVIFTFNGTNYAPANISSTYYVNLTDLYIGNYTYKWWANDTQAYSNETAYYPYSITKGTPVLTLSFTPSRNVIYPTATNVSCSADFNETAFYLYRNGTLVDNPDIQTNLAVGVYNYTCNISETENFTYAEVSNELVVNAGNDTESPSIEFLPPTPNNTAIYNTTQVINVSASDLNLANITIYVNGSAVVTCSYPLTVCTYSLVSDGNYSFYAIAYDSFENWNMTETRNITIDLTPPGVQFVFPTPENGIYNSSQTINVTIDDLYYDSISIYVNNLLMQSCYNMQYCEYNISGEGNFLFYGLGNDTAGNTNITELRNITIDYCTPNITNITGDWYNITGCLANDTMLWERNITETDLNYCNESNLSVYYEYNYTECDYCTPNLVNTSWTEWINISCLPDDTMNQTRNRTQYDENYCGEIENETFFEFRNTEYCDYPDNPIVILSADASPIIIINGTTENLFINAVNATNYYADITLPNGTVVRLNLTNNANTSFTDTLLTGIYNVTFFAENFAYVANTTDWFVVAPLIEWNISIINSSTGGVDSNITMYLVREEAYYNESTIGLYLLQGIPDWVFDMVINAFNGRLQITFLNDNISEDNNKTLGLDYKEYCLGFLAVYSIEPVDLIAWSDSQVTLSYAGLNFTNENNLKLYKCDDFDFFNQSCNGTWVLISQNKNTTTQTFTFNATTFSGFAIKESSDTGGGSGGGGGAAKQYVETKYASHLKAVQLALKTAERAQLYVEIIIAKNLKKIAETARLIVLSARISAETSIVQRQKAA